MSSGASRGAGSGREGAGTSAGRARRDRSGAIEELDWPLAEGLSRSQRALLEDPIRYEIVPVLRETPGLNVSQLARRVGVSRNTVEFHLRRLVRSRIVVTTQTSGAGERLCFLADDRHLAEDEATLVLFGHPSKRRIALFVAENPAVTTTRMARAMDLESSTIRHHLRALRDHGLVDRIRQRNLVRYYATDSLTHWIEEVGRGYRRRWRERREP